MPGAETCFWLAIALFALSFATLAWVILSSFSEGAIAYAGEYSDSTARELEDIFLFIPPRRVAEAGWALAAMAFLLVLLPALPAFVPKHRDYYEP